MLPYRSPEQLTHRADLGELTVQACFCSDDGLRLRRASINQQCHRDGDQPEVLERRDGGVYVRECDLAEQAEQPESLAGGAEGDRDPPVAAGQQSCLADHEPEREQDRGAIRNERPIASLPGPTIRSKLTRKVSL